MTRVLVIVNRVFMFKILLNFESRLVKVAAWVLVGVRLQILVDMVSIVSQTALLERSPTG